MVSPIQTRQLINGDDQVRPVISLLTDFGLIDPFVAEMKATILSLCPDAEIIDITHLVDKFDVRMGAFLLAGATPYFPRGTVHVGVVDPGVGSERRPIVIETGKCLFVGPDNGLLVPAATNDGMLHVYELTNRSLMRSEVSSTFHGRDVFAPAAAHLASGASPKECGPEISDYVKPKYAHSTIDGTTATCEIFHVDSFGNLVTSLPNADLAKLNLKSRQKVRVAIGGKRLTVRYVTTYSDLDGNEIGILVGSHGFVELACREKNAAKLIGARRGNAVRVYGGSVDR